MNVATAHVSPSLSTFSCTIEQRVKAGVQSLSACLEKAENKREILKHVRDLVLQVNGRFPSRPRRNIFEGPLEKIFCLEECRSLTTEILLQQNDRTPHKMLSAPTQLQLDRILESSSNNCFARLIRSHCGLDASKEFVLILAQVEVLWQPMSSQMVNNDKTGMRLDIRFNEAVPAIWELHALDGLCDGDTVWFGVRSAIMTMAMTPSLGNLRLSMIADTDDGRSQHLGTFTMSSVLSSTVDVGQGTTPATRHQFPFMRYVSFIAEGYGAQSLHRMTGRSKSTASRTTSLQTRENLACLSVNVGCGTELAMSVAQLEANTDDAVEIRGSTPIRPSSLSWLDDLLLSLEAESDTIRGLAARRDAFGYTLADIKQIMEMQLVTDDNFGMMEEGHLGS